MSSHLGLFVSQDDLLTQTARAKTGSGKTAAYVLPVLQAILQQKSVSLIGFLIYWNLC